MGDLVAGGGALRGKPARVGQAGEGQRGVDQRDSENRRGTTVHPDVNFFNRIVGHLGKGANDAFLHGMGRVDVIGFAQPAQQGMGQKTGVFAGAVVAVWPGGFAARLHGAAGGVVRGRLRAAQQIFFAQPQARLELGDDAHMLIGAGVRGAHQSQFGLADGVPLDPAHFHKRQNLQRFGGGTQVGNVIWIAQAGH